MIWGMNVEQEPGPKARRGRGRGRRPLRRHADRCPPASRRPDPKRQARRTPRPVPALLHPRWHLHGRRRRWRAARGRGRAPLPGAGITDRGDDVEEGRLCRAVASSADTIRTIDGSRSRKRARLLATRRHPVRADWVTGHGSQVPSRSRRKGWRFCAGPEIENTGDDEGSGRALPGVRADLREEWDRGVDPRAWSRDRPDPLIP